MMWRSLAGVGLAVAVLAGAVLVPTQIAVAHSLQEAPMSKKPLPKPKPTNNYGWNNPNKSTETVVPKRVPQDVNQGRDVLQTRSPMQMWTPSAKRYGRGAEQPPANLPQQFNTFSPREQQYYRKLQGDGTQLGQQRMQDFLNQYWFQDT